MDTSITAEGYEVSQTPAASFARTRLEEAIEAGRQSGAETLARIQRDAPTDAIVRAGALNFVPASNWKAAGRI